MKRIIFFFILTVSISTVSAQVDLEFAKKYGLISYLTVLKFNAEQKLASNKLNDTVIKIYIDLKIYTDLLINQIEADMIQKSCLKPYKKANRCITHNRKNKYYDLIIKISNKYNELQQLNSKQKDNHLLAYNTAFINKPKIADIDLLDVGNVAIELQKYNLNRIQALSSLLDKVRLSYVNKPITKQENITPGSKTYELK